jgi:hypothetical protein
MTTVERLENWKHAGIISDAQHATLSALVRKERFSLFLELNALLYLGVLSLTGGLAWTFSTHFEKLGDVFILTLISALLAGSLYYCWSKAPAYSNQEVESPNFIFDYVLYLACLLLSVELGYIEFRFEWLRDAWNNYLLFSSVVFFVLAYRFDNRFVLSLALSSLAGWFGLKVSKYGFISSEPLRLSALVYAFLIAVVGTFMYRQQIKKHFLGRTFHCCECNFHRAGFRLVRGCGTSFWRRYCSCPQPVLRWDSFRAVCVCGLRIVFGYIGISFEVHNHV